MSYASQGLSLRTKYSWLAIYFALNLALTLFNKVILEEFPFPYVFTSVHAIFGTLGCFILERKGMFTLTRLTDKESITLLFFSFLYTINIAISNLSLKLVTVPFHQVVRATTPLFALGINVVLYQSSYSILTYVSLIFVVAGVGFATYDHYYFKPMGFFLTFLGAFLAALKTVITNRIQTGRLKLSPLELLFRMSPLGLAQTLVYAYFTGEISTIYNTLNVETTHLVGLKSFAKFEPSISLFVKLALNGIIAFGLNVVSFTANKYTGALTMTVIANVKQVITIVFAIVFFDLYIDFTKGLGIALTLIGSIWYAKLELDGNQKNVTPVVATMQNIDTKMRNDRKE